MTAKQAIGLIVETSYFHGTASGVLDKGKTGLHVGTFNAAWQALTATIGYPVDGIWDGTREYGKTLLCGKTTLKKRGIFATGFNCGASETDFYPRDIWGTDQYATFSNEEPIPLDCKPDVLEVEITGNMSNSPWRPHKDWPANGRMKGLLKRGKARSGYFYRNDGEDAGSISATLPGPGHIKKIERYESLHEDNAEDALNQLDRLSGLVVGYVTTIEWTGTRFEITSETCAF